MGDWPLARLPSMPVLSTFSMQCIACQVGVATAAGLGTAVWPAINRAIYVPVQLEVPATAFKMSFLVGISSGNYDIGIYDETQALLVSKGTTAVPAAGAAIVDTTDTALNPGTYFLGLVLDNVTVTIQRLNVATVALQGCGVLQQALGSTVLPSTITPAAPTGGYLPQINAHLVVAT